ncbi:hypothetical protein JCM25156A_32220 [Komagataeibacter kakiaceti JCM 25156]|uniref:hypothetical protein n=1 Tax=Komagataeibacter kakiaceti TaxID=943261 RepID=UPI0004716E68|nr:hypothetical protein [Komagataeibacter kakiaceti]
MALSDDRALDRIRCGARPEFPLSVAAGFCVYRGAITAVCQDGTAVPAGSTGTPSPLVAIMGIARGRQDNSGTSQVYGDQSGPGPAWIEKDAFALPFDTAPTWANVGATVYAIDDETVSLTETPEGGTARLQVGTLSGLDENGVPFVLIQ